MRLAAHDSGDVGDHTDGDGIVQNGAEVRAFGGGQVTGRLQGEGNGSVRTGDGVEPVAIIVAVENAAIVPDARTFRDGATGEIDIPDLFFTEGLLHQFRDQAGQVLIRHFMGTFKILGERDRRDLLINGFQRGADRGGILQIGRYVIAFVDAGEDDIRPSGNEIQDAETDAVRRGAVAGIGVNTRNGEGDGLNGNAAVERDAVGGRATLIVGRDDPNLSKGLGSLGQANDTVRLDAVVIGDQDFAHAFVPFMGATLVSGLEHFQLYY